MIEPLVRIDRVDGMVSTHPDHAGRSSHPSAVSRWNQPKNTYAEHAEVADAQNFAGKIRHQSTIGPKSFRCREWYTPA
ncbi:MAG: hypothetical protein ABSH53_09945 [Holophaga sp.]|jgi:hypothetical protein